MRPFGLGRAAIRRLGDLRREREQLLDELALGRLERQARVRHGERLRDAPLAGLGEH